MNGKSIFDFKFIVTLVISLVFGTGSAIAALMVGREENREKMRTVIEAAVTQMKSALEQSKTEANERFATKEESAFIRQMLIDVKDSVQLANDRLYDIQKNQVLVKVANDRLVTLNRKLTVQTKAVSQLTDQVEDQSQLVKEALEKKKKKK